MGLILVFSYKKCIKNFGEASIKMDMLWRRDVDGTGSESRPVAGFGIGGIHPQR
jgi:hypothetical protein